MTYRITPHSDELCHYGVLGMRWGVRRYQNYDGTRIGTGGTPVVNKAKTAEGTVKKLKSTMDKGFRNTVSGGQGGKTTGNARFAATAGGSNSSNKSESDSDTEGNGWFDRSIKKGKDKEKSSPAEEMARGARDITRDSKNALRSVEKLANQKKNSDQANTQANKARKMSDQELRNEINRIKMEKEYVSLTSQDTNAGWEKAQNILEVAGDVASIALTVLGIIATVKKLKHSEDDTFREELNNLLNLGNFDDDFIAHAMALDDEYLMHVCDISEDDVNDYLAHYGVLGMKWGVRRYQNYDGTRIGAGSGSGGGGGGSSASKSFRGSVATGQGGRATGNARLAAKPLTVSDVKDSGRKKRKKEIMDLDQRISNLERKGKDLNKKYAKEWEERTKELGPYNPKDPKNRDAYIKLKEELDTKYDSYSVFNERDKLITELRTKYSKLSYDDLDEDLVRYGAENTDLADWQHPVSLLTGKWKGPAELTSVNKHIHLDEDPISYERIATKKRR